ncbi:putative spherulin-1b precursor protein [Neofusicoccum parvum]|nr:putative spherulin-1b precursor protein [Neofusicoccum parvum]
MHASINFLASALLLSSAALAAPTNPSTTDSYDYPTTTAPPTTDPTTPANPAGLTLFQQLVLAENAVERTKLLPNDADFVFDFKNAPAAGVVTGDGGSIVRADHATFPALVGSGGAVAIGFLGPCGFNTPHVHPRAAELNLVVQGRLVSESVHENGARFINHNLDTFQMTVFPQGAVHTEFNPDCTDAVFIASFPDEDPGVGQIAQEYFGLTNEIVKGSAGGEVVVDGKDIDQFRSMIPKNVAKGVDSCLAKCGIQKR